MLASPKRFDVAIMADEALTGPDSAYRIAKNHGADVFAVKIEQSGGLIEACEVGKIAGLAGIDLYGGTMLEGQSCRKYCIGPCICS